MKEIPKILHYCWFGRNPLPDSAKKCIASWKKYFPEYKVIEWNEDNFNVKAIPFIEEAYSKKKYAFVSDYARFKVLYEYGGIYFDTDVEVVSSFDDILANGSFMGSEAIIKKSEIKSPLALNVNPGLGLGAYKGHPFLKEMIDFYGTLRFIKDDGTFNMETIVNYTTAQMMKYGLEYTDAIQHVAGFSIYPRQYFSPYNYLIGKLEISEHTHSIHWYSMTWLKQSRFRLLISQLVHRIFGTYFISKLRNIFS